MCLVQRVHHVTSRQQKLSHHLKQETAILIDQQLSQYIFFRKKVPYLLAYVFLFSVFF